MTPQNAITNEIMNSIKVIGGNLKDEYEFWQLHFHWGGPGSYGGSEHTIDNVSAGNLKLNVQLVNLIAFCRRTLRPKLTL